MAIRTQYDAIINAHSLRIGALEVSGAVGVQAYGAVGDGVTDDSQAFIDALVANRHVVAPSTGLGYKIDSSITMPSRTTLECFDDMISGVGSGNALFKFTNSSGRSNVFCYRKCTGGGNGDICLLMEWGIANHFYFTEIETTFETGVLFRQAVGGFAAGHTLTENIIEYGVILANKYGVRFMNTTGDSAVPMEGTELRGGGIFSADTDGVLVEANVNAKYLVITGVIDCAAASGQDYTNNVTGASNALIISKFIREGVSTSTFADGDILINARTGTFVTNNLTVAAPGLDITAKAGGAQPISGVKVIGMFTGGGTEATKYGTILATSNDALSSADAASLAAYYDPGTSTPPVAADAKLAGLIAAFRRNDNASAIAGAGIEFRKRAASDLIDTVLLSRETGGATDALVANADGYLSSPGPLVHPITTLANNATPTVLNVSLAKTGGTTTITDFDNGIVGQSFELLAAHILTITHNASIVALDGAGNFAMKVGDTLTLRMFNNQVWQETSRTTLA